MQISPRLDESVHLVSYDSQWPLLFKNEAKQLIHALGTRAIQIEHIGSTAVPGLTSKPVIDILIGLLQMDSLEEVALAITELGFEDMGEAGIPGRRHLRKRCHIAVNVHVVQIDSNLWQNNILIRDYLRTHSEAAISYSRHKQTIISSGTNKLLAYSKQKTDFMQDLLRQAQNWAASK